MLLLFLAALTNQNKIDSRKQKNASSIQYGYGKCGTNAQIQTLAGGNSKNEIERDTE